MISFKPWNSIPVLLGEVQFSSKRATIKITFEIYVD